jgi:2-phospho-L-lactate guanylyltransferase (CobY/MobA/RfbA family)
VAAFALECGAEVITSRATDLNEAVTHAYGRLQGRFEHLLIAHGDIRDPRGLGDYRPRDGVTVITDAQGTGTNVLALPSDVNFTFCFGHHSARAHQREARRLGLDVHMDFESPWRFDVDEPSDLTA